MCDRSDAIRKGGVGGAGGIVRGGAGGIGRCGVGGIGRCGVGGICGCEAWWACMSAKYDCIGGGERALAP